MMMEKLIERFKKVIEAMRENEYIMQRSADRLLAIEKFIRLLEEDPEGASITDEQIYRLIKYGD